MKCVALLSLALLGCLTAGPARAGTWTELAGAEALRELISGATATIELKSGVTQATPEDLIKGGDLKVTGDSAEASRLINLFDRYSPEKAVVVPSALLDHM